MNRAHSSYNSPGGFTVGMRIRSDVNANGHIDSIDVTTVQRANSTGLP